MNALEAIKARRTTRWFSDRQVPEKELELIVEAGTNAPHDGTFRIHVIQNAEMLECIDAAAMERMLSFDVPKLKEQFSLPGMRVLYNAPTLVLISGRTFNPMMQLNAAVAFENMAIAATALGVDCALIASPASAFDPTTESGRNLAEQMLAVEQDLPKIQQQAVMPIALLLGYRKGEDPWPWGNREDRASVTHYL